MRIGILEAGKLPETLEQNHGPYANMFERLLSAADPTLTFRNYAAIDGELPTDPAAADAWLVTGSRHGVYDDLPFMAPLSALIRSVHAAQIPLIGVCFGHQIIAEALGGKVVKSEKGWGLGLHRYSLTEPAPWMGDVSTGHALKVHAVHQDQVVEVPDNARVLASSEFCPNAMIAYGDTTFTVQPHPEFEAPFVGELITERLTDTAPEAVIASARGGLGGETDNALLALWMVEFLAHAKAHRAESTKSETAAAE